MYEEEDINGLEESLLGINSDEDLEGLGRAAGVNMTPAIKSIARKFAAKRAPSVKPQLSRAQKQFLVQEKDLDADTKRRMKEGALQLVDGDFYVRKQIAGGGQLVILDPTTIKKIGVSSFDKNRLPDLVNMILSRIKLSYGTAGLLIVDPAAVSYTTSGAAVPLALLNGEITVLIDDKPIYRGRIAKFFTDPAVALVPHMIESMSTGISMENPKLIKAQAGLTVTISIADGSLLSALANHFLECVFMGPVTQTR
jgi:hypothetical protein